MNSDDEPGLPQNGPIVGRESLEMRGTSGKSSPSTLVRVLLWLGSLLLAVFLFSLLISRGASLEAVVIAFKITMMCALPAWFLYLPLVFLLEDANERRGWVLLVTGFVIGPASMALSGLILQLRGEDARLVWLCGGDPTSFIGNMVYAAFVGSLTTGLYVTSVKFLSRRML
jgi:hypothetical protein